MSSFLSLFVFHLYFSCLLLLLLPSLLRCPPITICYSSYLLFLSSFAVTFVSSPCFKKTFATFLSCPVFFIFCSSLISLFFFSVHFSPIFYSLPSSSLETLRFLLPLLLCSHLLPLLPYLLLLSSSSQSFLSCLLSSSLFISLSSLCFSTFASLCHICLLLLPSLLCFPLLPLSSLFVATLHLLSPVSAASLTSFPLLSTLHSQFSEQ